jgi:hypothetical protein
MLASLSADVRSKPLPQVLLRLELTGRAIEHDMAGFQDNGPIDQLSVAGTFCSTMHSP